MASKLSTHFESSREHFAVNVKTHGIRLAEVEGETEQQRESAWDVTVEQFWQEAEEIARQCGYAKVYSEGRSSGWLVPAYAGTYPDIDDRAEQRRFARFEKQIRELMTGVAESFNFYLTEIVDDAREAEENATRIVREFCQSM